MKILFYAAIWAEENETPWMNAKERERKGGVLNEARKLHL